MKHYILSNAPSLLLCHSGAPGDYYAPSEMCLKRTREGKGRCVPNTNVLCELEMDLEKSGVVPVGGAVLWGGGYQDVKELRRL